MITRFVLANRRACLAFDRLLSPIYSADGNREFLDSIVPRYLAAARKVVDVGGGRHPVVSPAVKMRLGLNVVGLDIDESELRAAPTGSYDEIVVADLGCGSHRAEADLVICQAVMEHVRDTSGAFRTLARLVRPGGRVLIFVPSRNAAFARINLLMPEGLKRRVLFTLFPEARDGQGFVSYYNQCTPKDFCRLADEVGLRIEELHLYWASAYFTFFLPLHVLWRAAQRLAKTLFGSQAAETFTIVLVKPDLCHDSGQTTFL